MAKGTTIRMWRRSLIVLTGLVFIGFGIIIARLFKLQIIDGNDLRHKALEQQLRNTEISAKRGTIFDCNMKPLAQSATVWTVVLEPSYLKDEKDKKIIAHGLSEILGIDEEELYKKASKKSYYIEIKRKIESDEKDKIIKFKKDNNISNGIRLIEDHKRYYPYGAFAASVIGFTGTDSQGLAGLEVYYDKDLKGEAGHLVTAKNAMGTDMPFDYEQRIEASNGHSLILSIDEVIQHIIEKHLEDGIRNNKVKNRAVAIMMDVNTGEILGMAVKGDFDLNNPFKIYDKEVLERIELLPEEERKTEKAKELERQWRNKAVNDAYIPGSTFKILTSSMAFEEGVVTENTQFNCQGSLVPYPGASRIHCHKHSGHGSQTFVEAICNSCNPAFIRVGQLLGPEKFYQYYSSFGLTKKTGIDLPGEMEGIFFSKDGSMTQMDLAVASFGQNFSITPIQMITAVSAVANGGNLVRPHVVRQIIDDNGNIVKSMLTEVKRQVISQQTSRKLCDILQRNATIGSGKNGYVAGYRIAGKTGTSEKKGADANLDGKDYISSYCGFAPADDPKVALLVLYDTPKGENYYGSMVAAPTFASIMEGVLSYLGIEKKYTDEELSNLDIQTPFLIGTKVQKAKSDIIELGLDPIIYGAGETVISQIPEAASKIPKGGRVVIYTEENNNEHDIVVPKLTGLTVSGVNREAANVKLNVSIVGANFKGEEVTSVKQSIPEGEKISPGTVVTVEFAQKDQVQ